MRNVARASATIAVQPSSFAALRERLGGVDGSVHEQAGRRAVPLGEHLPAVHLDDPVPAAADELVELVESRRGNAVADRLAAFDDERLRPRAVTLDDREEDGAAAALPEPGELRDELHSTASTNTSISPPQGSPTDHARSSLIP